MAIVTVDGVDVEVGDNERLNLIQAADRAGVKIPFYCWHPGLSVVASCRMCLVETGTRNSQTGEISMLPKLVPACQTPAKDGTVVVTQSDKVRANQKFVQEGLLLDHPVDCPICDQAGECWLQDYYFQYGHQERRADVRPFTSRRRDLGPHVTLFVDRCVMCSRCVRFTREVSGGGELMVVDRGSHAEIDVFPGHPIDNPLSGNVNDICPVGALCSKDFLYQQRVWFMRAHDSICTRCSAGCSTQLHVGQNHLYRVQPRYNPNANQWWMCDLGRFENGYVHAAERLTCIKQRGAERFDDLPWSDGLARIRQELAGAAQPGRGARLAFVLSPFLTCEEAFLLALFAQRQAPQAALFLGRVPVVGVDQTFKSGFTLRAERCPNRLGVSEILQHFQGQVLDWSAFVERAERGDFDAAYVTSNDPEPWIDEAQAGRLDRVALLIVHDLLPGPLARRARFVVPGASFAEKDGSYVNHAGLLQSTSWGVRPADGAHVDGQTFFGLLERRGLFQARPVLRELAATVPFFARAAEDVPEAGLNLLTGNEIRPRTTQPGTVTHPAPTFKGAASMLLEVEPPGPFDPAVAAGSSRS